MVRVAAPRWVCLEGPAGACWVAGVRLHEGECVRLEAGAHQVLVVARIGATSPWGRITLRPRLRAVSDEERVRRRAEVELAAAVEADAYAFDLAESQALGGASSVHQPWSAL